MTEEGNAMPEHEATRLTTEEARRARLKTIEGSKALKLRRDAAKRARKSRKKNRQAR